MRYAELARADTKLRDAQLGIKFCMECSTSFSFCRGSNYYYLMQFGVSSERERQTVIQLDLLQKELEKQE